MAPIENVDIIQGDITKMETVQKILASIGGKAEIVVCDGAPDVTGLHELDQYLQHSLVISALNITTLVLQKGGIFIAKIFRGKDISLLYSQCQQYFERVVVSKPKSSRNASYEAFIICQNFQLTPEIEQNVELQLQNTLNLQGNNEAIPEMIACSGAWDADLNYVQTEESLGPIAPPINAAYQTYIKMFKQGQKNQTQQE